MVSFSIIRKIGKILRGGAGRKEIFLGMFCGILMGFQPVIGLTLGLLFLLTLLLNANIGFALMGLALGKLLSLLLASLSFHTGVAIVHAFEPVFIALVNMPVTALMDFDVYAMTGGLPYALVLGFIAAKLTSGTVNRIREEMVRAGEKDSVQKVTKNKFFRFLMWLVFGKQKVSVADVLAKQSPLFRKAGIILVAVVLLIGGILEFFLLDYSIEKGLKKAISAKTEAQVDVANLDFAIWRGALQIEGLEIADAEKLTHNKLQIDHLVADLSLVDLLSGRFVIDRVSGSVLKFDQLRETPAEPLTLADEGDADEEMDESASAPVEAWGESLDAYLAQAEKWQKYGQLLYDYLKEQREEAKEEETREVVPVEVAKERALWKAEHVGYLKASAALRLDAPALVIHKLVIEDVLLGDDYPAQLLEGFDLSTNPRFLGKPTVLQMRESESMEPALKLVLHLESPKLFHELTVEAPGVPVEKVFELSDDVPLDLSEGECKLSARGTFSVDFLNIPFRAQIHGLKADIKEGEKKVLGMDRSNARKVLESMETITLEGVLGGSLKSPRVKIDFDKLTAQMKDALVDAGKREASRRVEEEKTKAKEKLKKKSSEKLKKLLGDKADDSEAAGAVGGLIDRFL